MQDLTPHSPHSVSLRSCVVLLGPFTRHSFGFDNIDLWLESGKLDRKQLSTQQLRGLKIKPGALDLKGVEPLDSNQLQPLDRKR